ncbi:MAG: ATP-binding protein [Candidatus Hodarchaeota archaeon]
MNELEANTAQNELKRRKRELVILSSIAQSVVRFPYLDSVLDIALTGAMAGLGGDFGRIYIFDEGRLVLATQHRHSSKFVQIASVWDGPALPMSVHVLDSINSGEKEEGIRCSILAPLKAEQEIIGLLVVSSRFADHFEVSRDAFFLEAVCGTLAVAIQEVRFLKDLAETTDFLQTVVGNVPVGVIVTDLQGVILEQNPLASSILEMAGKGDSILTNIREIATVFDKLLNSLLTEDPRRSSEFSLISQSGVVHCRVTVAGMEVHGASGFGISVSPIESHKKTKIRLVWLIEDVTEEKRALKRSFQSEKLAATGRLAASIVHELNTPLSAISNILYLVKKKLDNEEDVSSRLDNEKYVSSRLDLLDREVKRLTSIVSQLSDFYRPSLESESLKVNNLIRECFELLESALRNVNLSLRFEFDDSDPDILASSDQIRQVIINLISNAIESFENGHEGQIKVSTEDLGNEVLLEFKDNGRGISKEDLPRIFEPFFSKKQSLGLGLWITDSIVKNHGGRIEVSSTLGEGTTFLVFLPRV